MGTLSAIDGYHPIFGFIYGFMAVDDDIPDGEWLQMHVEAVDAYNKLGKTGYNFYDFQDDYFEWHAAQIDADK